MFCLLSASLPERAYLERSIGRTGLLALEPLRVTSHRDYWHQHLLAQRGKSGIRKRIESAVRVGKP